MSLSICFNNRKNRVRVSSVEKHGKNTSVSHPYEYELQLLYENWPLYLYLLLPLSLFQFTHFLLLFNPRFFLLFF
jgi:hypothetical protein